MFLARLRLDLGSGSGVHAGLLTSAATSSWTNFQPGNNGQAVGEGGAGQGGVRPCGW